MCADERQKQTKEQGGGGGGGGSSLFARWDSVEYGAGIRAG